MSSDELRDTLLSAMGADKARVTSNIEPNLLVPGQTAAVWFTNNRVERPRRVCVIQRGPDLVFQYDQDPHGLESQRITFGQTPFMSWTGVAGFLVSYLLD